MRSGGNNRIMYDVAAVLSSCRVTYGTGERCIYALRQHPSMEESGRWPFCQGPAAWQLRTSNGDRCPFLGLRSLVPDPGSSPQSAQVCMVLSSYVAQRRAAGGVYTYRYACMRACMACAVACQTSGLFTRPSIQVLRWACLMMQCIGFP